MYAPTPDDFISTANVDFSLPVAEQESRYLAVTLAAAETTFSEDRLTARINSEARFEDPNRPASSLWVVAVAYDENDQPVGFRRFDTSQPIDVSQPLPFNVTVYSMAGAIARVELHAEARPILP